MQHPLIELSPEKNISGDEMEDEHDYISLQKSSTTIDVDPAPRTQEATIIESYPLESHQPTRSEVSNVRVMQRNSVQETVTPALFDSYTPPKFAPFGNKQSVVSLEDIKKQHSKVLPKWDHCKKVKPVERQDRSVDRKLKPSNSRANIAPANCKPSTEPPQMQGKYMNVESKVKQHLRNNSSNRRAVSPLVQRKTTCKRIGELNISNIAMNHRSLIQKPEDQSIIQDLIEMDFSSMINQINQKKDILLDKIKAIHSTHPEQVKRGGTIVRNVRKPQENTTVDLIDLYSNMIQQKQKRGQENKENTRPRSPSLAKESPPRLSKREPGKITRQGSTKKNNEVKQQLEEEYQSALNHAKTIQQKLQQLNENEFGSI